jgi:hypothetical protein
MGYYILSGNRLLLSQEDGSHAGLMTPSINKGRFFYFRELFGRDDLSEESIRPRDLRAHKY